MIKIQVWEEKILMNWNFSFVLIILSLFSKKYKSQKFKNLETSSREIKTHITFTCNYFFVEKKKKFFVHFLLMIFIFFSVNSNGQQIARSFGNDWIWKSIDRSPSNRRYWWPKQWKIICKKTNKQTNMLISVCFIQGFGKFGRKRFPSTWKRFGDKKTSRSPTQ